MELIHVIETTDEFGVTWITEEYGVDGIVNSTNTFRKES